jgi:hypothetical protein
MSDLFGRGQMFPGILHSLCRLLEIAQLKGVTQITLFLLA